MFKFLHRNLVLQWTITLVLLLLSVYLMINSSNILSSNGYPIFYYGFVYFISKSILAYRIFTMMIIILSLLLIQIYFTRNNFVHKTSVLPSIFYLIFVIISGIIKQPGAVLISNLFIIIILMINDTYYKTNSKSKLFFIGMIYGISILIELTTLPLIAFIIVSLFMNTVIKPKDLVIIFFGILTIGIYLFALFYFTDQLDFLISNFQQIKMYTIFTSPIQLKPIQWAILPILFFIFLYIILKINKVYENKVIVMRKKMITFNVLILCLIGTILFTNGTPGQFISYFIIPFSILFSIFSQFKSKYFIHDFLILLFIIGLWVY